MGIMCDNVYKNVNVFEYFIRFGGVFIRLKRFYSSLVKKEKRTCRRIDMVDATMF